MFRCRDHPPSGFGGGCDWWPKWRDFGFGGHDAASAAGLHDKKPGWFSWSKKTPNALRAAVKMSKYIFRTSRGFVTIWSCYFFWCRFLTAPWVVSAPGRALRCPPLHSQPASSESSCRRRAKKRWGTRGGWFPASLTSLLVTCPTTVTTLPPQRAKRCPYNQFILFAF